MRVLVVSASGIIGRAFVAALQSKHEIVPATRGSTAIRVGIIHSDSIQAKYRAVGKIDAVVCPPARKFHFTRTKKPFSLCPPIEA